MAASNKNSHLTSHLYVLLSTISLVWFLTSASTGENPTTKTFYVKNQGITEFTTISYTQPITSTIGNTALQTATSNYQVRMPLVLNHWPPIPYKPNLWPIQDADTGYINLIWSEAPAQLADLYIVEEAKDAAFTTGLHEVCVTELQSCFLYRNLAGTYYYRVRGNNAWGLGEWSNIQIAIVLAPDAPILDSIDNADGDGYYTITWNSAPRATGYLLVESTNAMFQDPITLYSGPELSWSIFNKPYGTYYYRVIATGPTGQSSPSNTQSVAVTPPPPGVTILGNHTTYPSQSGDFRYVVGEVYNNTNYIVRFVKISTNFFNGSQLVETENAYIFLENLHPHEKTCFAIFLNNPSSWTHYDFEPVSYSLYGQQRPSLTITNYSGSVCWNDYYRIIGQITNNESFPIYFVSAIATLYNNLGKVLACDYNYVNSTDLNPGQTSSFEILAYPLDPVAITSYYLQTNGSR
jgi:hypothetical protein